MTNTPNRPNNNQHNNANTKKPNNNKKRFFNKNAGPNNQGPANSNTANSGANKKKNFFKRKTTAVKHGGADYITTKYLNLLDQHIQARRKYFENFDKVTGPTLDKLEQNFIDSQKLFLSFKEKLNDEDRKLFEARYESLKPDQIYSKNHNLTDDAYRTSLADVQIEDPHLLESQKRASFKEDTEESVGTLEDYKSYKQI